MSLTFLGETPSDETKNECLDAVFFKCFEEPKRSLKI